MVFSIKTSAIIIMSRWGRESYPNNWKTYYACMFVQTVIGLIHDNKKEKRKNTITSMFIMFLLAIAKLLYHKR